MDLTFDGQFNDLFFFSCSEGIPEAGGPYSQAIRCACAGRASKENTFLRSSRMR